MGGPEVGGVRAVFMSPSPRLRQHGCAFLVDEVQTGGGCTGSRRQRTGSRKGGALGGWSAEVAPKAFLKGFILPLCPPEIMTLCGSFL